MTESFLHYIWQFQFFEKSELKSCNGEALSIFNTGRHNTHAGPDFFSAKIRIGDIEWIGNVEIHIYSSEWFQHRHDIDPNYDNVILHVVWKQDRKVVRNDGTELPTLELSGRISEELLLSYKRLINAPGKIPCAGGMSKVRDIVKLSMLEKSLMSRLEAKAAQIQKKLERNNADWEETCYQILCKSFGFKVNAEPFEQLSLALPYKTLMKHADHPVQVEALLFGQAGFLELSGHDEYFKVLQREYTLLSKKFQLHELRMNKAQWKFLRLRPANFPSMRIAQLAALISTEKNLFSRIISSTGKSDLLKLFSVEQSPYWKTHYQFFKPMTDMIAPLGESSIQVLIVNAVVPLLVAYGRAKDNQLFVDRAVEILHELPSEENAIVRLWRKLEIRSNSAFDSQGLIELHNNFCQRRRCLDCNIGFSLLEPKDV